MGKSTLFNKIVGHMPAVTSDVAGTTRDRQYQDTAWNGKNFTLVDTAGLSNGPKNELELNVRKQIEVAMEEADVIILVMDGKQNRNVMDESVLKSFRRIKKPLILCVNKLDSPRQREAKLEEFKSFGIKKLFGVSAISGAGTGDMLDYIAEVVKNTPAEEATDETAIAISIVGKPNVGKSSIFNKILDEERVVVSSVPGTTRTAIDSDITIEGQKYTFIDTAGLKKKTYRQEQPDVFGGFQTFKAIRRSDVCLFVIDSVEELTKQDQRVAQEIFAMEKGCIVVCNKIDLFKGDTEKLKDYVSMHFPFLWMCPVFFVSGKTGKGLKEALDAIKPIYDRRHKSLTKETLQEFLTKALKKNEPKLLRDQRKPKVLGLTQVDVNPPAFQLYVNYPAAISMQFRKFLENSIIRELDYYGTPIVVRLKGKDKS